MTAVSIFHLEMLCLEQFNPKLDAKDLTVIKAEKQQYEFNKFLYQFVGSAWQWTDKLSWTDEQWQAYSEADNLHLYVAYFQGSPAGYFELQQQAQGNVEIMYFGLGNRFIGQGMGGYLLSQAIENAWALSGTQRVWVHTCSLDHPSALLNYQARGFKLFKTEIE
ncbi:MULTISPECIES: GNAT family N-acetyltransferase [unclassified Shewanella]|uniref:GNAT family N-acetyltransferase n=1 Tax=unclassified Shewanella TaxID=196818 RepID=UPI000C842E55|nr:MULTISPECIES: GNAT family N-acetyltransferase [unclassified Shewanella]MDO6777037.1 GNAT family N-acetyltransferase [Shewanella sp. 3_MG-2023]PMH88104.1 GNAT family N-acetyltransferase [Shewanella sp. 10N.286.48.B5]